MAFIKVSDGQTVNTSAIISVAKRKICDERGGLVEVLALDFGHHRVYHITFDEWENQMGYVNGIGWGGSEL